MEKLIKDLQETLANTLSSPNERDRNWESPANVVDGLFAISRAIDRLAEAVEAIAERQ